MRGPWRAALALALHIGFFALPFTLVVGLLGIAAFTARYETVTGLRVGVAAVVVTAVLAVGLRAVLRTRTQPRGVALTKSAQPQLWKMAGALASAVGAEQPDEVRLTYEPRARVRQDTPLLGLRSRACYLEIGLPLVASLAVSELHAAVAREFGLVAGRSKLTATAYRIAVSVEHAHANLTDGPTKWLFTGYTRFLTAVTRPTVHELELDADAIAVRLVGKRTCTTTLRKLTAIEFGWREFAEEYLSMAKTVRQTPDVLLGFRSFVENSERKPELAERAKQRIAEEPDAGGQGHPTTRERIEVIKRLSSRDEEDDDRPAFALLRNPRRSVPALEDQLLADGLGQRVPWPELARQAGAAHVAHQAGMLSSAVLQSGVIENPALGAILGCLYRGEGATLINPVLNPGLAPERVDEVVVDTLTELVGDTVVDALVTAERAHHELDWGGASIVRLLSGQPLDPDRLVRPAITDPQLIPRLHQTLVDLGVPLGHSRPPAPDPVPVLAGVVSAVQFAGERHELLVTDRGLLLVPSQISAVQRLLAGAWARARRAEEARLAELEATPISELRKSQDAQWIDSRDVANARLRQQRQRWKLRCDLYLDEYAVSSIDSAGISTGYEGTFTVELHGTGSSEERGDPYGGLGEMMGARLRVSDGENLPE